MSDEKHRTAFARHLPEGAVDYVMGLWKELKFHFKITPNRQTKYGDYRYDPNTRKHSISVNGTLNIYAFLITYIHEVAHKTNYDLHQNRVDPHGKEWKHQFKKLMIPMLREDIFPMDILAPLARHMKNPKATSVSDPELFKALRKYDKPSTDVFLSDIETGHKFLFRKKIYLKVKQKRTRVLCEAIDTGKQYLISSSAPVQQFKNSK
ncbi:SprT-like domain-containing protein [Reichenbachiella agariperforans]|uniref:SprT-like domain-containing protein n=1 Tax=Reichenbachiella agariperforans TaxID=156994 RepID=UPI001C096461|nr:SprT-like domain-containing protein [Reichenbachiella agariperforans]MBU2913485.1 SprT-like domain-containing protein [Reichenbachiella agariperforans]